MEFETSKKKVIWAGETNMKIADFRLLICAVVFLFLNVIMLIVYSQVVLKQARIDEPVDVIFVARGRRRAALQHNLWIKWWDPLAKNTLSCFAFTRD